MQFAHAGKEALATGESVDTPLQDQVTHFEKISIPSEFIGLKFQDVFHALLRGGNAHENSCIPIAIFRPAKSLRSFPQIIVVPKLDDLVEEDDELFILKPWALSNALSVNYCDISSDKEFKYLIDFYAC